MPDLEIRTDRLLLVEGRDEINLFTAMIRDCFDARDIIQIIDAGGKDRFSERLESIVLAASGKVVLQAIGVVRDADDNARGSFDSVCHSVSSAGCVPPELHGEFSDSLPSIGVFIVPDGASTGAIETVCRHSLQGGNVARCVDEYLRCLTRYDAMRSRNEDKSFAHAYLAAMPNPVARVGEGALRRYWNLESPSFAPLRRFVRDLGSKGEADHLRRRKPERRS